MHHKKLFVIIIINIIIIITIISIIIIIINIIINDPHSWEDGGVVKAQCVAQTFDLYTVSQFDLLGWLTSHRKGSAKSLCVHTCVFVLAMRVFVASTTDFIIFTRKSNIFFTLHV